MNTIKNIIILLIVLIFSYLLGSTAGELYNIIFGQSGTYIDLSFFSGLPLMYIFSLIFLFTAFGDRHKAWWIGILLIPAAVFEIYFDFAHIYFPIALGIAGWLLGKGVNKLRGKG